MKLRILGSPVIEGTYEVQEMSLKDIYTMAGGRQRPRLIQVGGALGKLYKDYDIQLSLSEVTEFLYEPTIAFFDDLFCPVDYMRFMVRFLIRELNIVNDKLRQINDLLTKITSGKSVDNDLKLMKFLLETPSDSKGEQMLKDNLAYMMRYFEKEISEHLKGYCRDSVCRGLFDAQCINACPAHIHIPGFVALMKEGKVDQAYRLMRQENPLSSICGSICARPCEMKCRRGEITSTVGVRSLQRFIANTALKGHYQEDCLPDKPYSIGIVGGGPGGLTAAYFLRRTGYQVTVYEKADRAGGTLAYGVPSYRLPNVSIQTEVDTITGLGVEIRFNSPVDLKTYETLKVQHDKVILATGTNIGKKLPIKHDHVVSGVEFLKAVRLNGRDHVGEKVVVIGGGDVAMDCARTARRLGAEVILLALEQSDALPASPEEQKFALEEGVAFLTGHGVQNVNQRTLHLKACLSLYDDAGKFDPVYGPSDQKIEAVDTVITCVGQEADLSYLPQGLSIISHEVEESVYALGDMIKPTVVIDAIAQGKSVAAMVDVALGGQGLYIGQPIEIPKRILNIRTFDFDLREESTLDLNQRLTSFREVTKTYDLQDAMYEAERCMRCDQNSKAPLQLGR